MVPSLAASVEQPAAAGSDRGSVVRSKINTTPSTEVIAKPHVVGCNVGPAVEAIGFQKLVIWAFIIRLWLD